MGELMKEKRIDELCGTKRLINQWRMNWFNGAREVDWIEGLFGFSWTGGWLWPQAAVMADGSCRITSKKNKQTTRNSNQQKTRKWMKWINQTKEMKAMELMKLMEWTSLAAFVWLMSGMEGPRAQAEAKLRKWRKLVKSIWWIDEMSGAAQQHQSINFTFLSSIQENKS